MVGSLDSAGVVGGTFFVRLKNAGVLGAVITLKGEIDVFIIGLIQKQNLTTEDSRVNFL